MKGFDKSLEQIVECDSIAQARNFAIYWLKRRGVVFDHRMKARRSSLPRSPLFGRFDGVEGDMPRYWCLRLDYDPEKGAHYNIMFDKRSRGEQIVFCFPGDESLIQALARSRFYR